MKEGKSTIYEQFSATGTGTKHGWYRYHLCRGKMVLVPTKVVPIPLTRTGLVPILVQVVPVPLLPTDLISCISTLLSQNSYIDSIGTLVND